MQFTGHLLLVHQFVPVPWDFNPVPYCQPSSPTPTPSLKWHVWPGRRSIYNIFQRMRSGKWDPKYMINVIKKIWVNIKVLFLRFVPTSLTQSILNLSKNKDNDIFLYIFWSLYFVIMLVRYITIDFWAWPGNQVPDSLWKSPKSPRSKKGK